MLVKSDVHAISMRTCLASCIAVRVLMSTGWRLRLLPPTRGEGVLDSPRVEGVEGGVGSTVPPCGDVGVEGVRVGVVGVEGVRVGVLDVHGVPGVPSL